MKKNDSFTLIEVLVVIAILAGLVAILFPNFMDIRERTRDTQRKNDIKQIQKALELYKENSNPPQYPATLPNPCEPFDAAGVVYLAKMPGDPKGNCTTNLMRYQYIPYASDNLRYELRACLENKNDISGTSTQGAPYFDEPVAQGGAGYTCSPIWLYVVTEP